MKLPYFEVAAFASRPFAGNPAGVCLLEQWLPDATMQAIGAENNLAETAFVVPQSDGYGLRWFTPASEIDLCGHATLASAHVLFHHRGVPGQIRALAPDIAKLMTLPNDGVIATAPGDDCDFVSRFFVPHHGINEDPVTGSTHCNLIPFWAERLGKQTLFARQLSKRGGEIFCELRGDRVRIGGHAITYLTGEIEIPA